MNCASQKVQNVWDFVVMFNKLLVPPLLFLTHFSNAFDGMTADELNISRTKVEIFSKVRMVYCNGSDNS